MPINAMIPMSGARRRRADPMGEAAQAIGIGNALQQRKMQAQDAERRNALSAALKGAAGPDGSVNWDAVQGAYVSAGDPMGAMKVAEGRSTLDANALAREKSEIDILGSKMEMALREYGQVNDQASHETFASRWMPQFPNGGLNLPPEFSPEGKQQLLLSGTDALGQLRMKLEQERFGETKRHNQVVEGNQPLVKIHDPTSPTRTRMVSRGEAKGMPGAKSDPLVTMGTEERAEDKAEGTRLVDQATSVFEAGDNARAELEQLMIARNIDVDFGALEPARNAVSALAQGLGFNPESIPGLKDATNAQAFTGIMQNLVLTKMQAQKGPQTENDAKRIEKTVSSLGNTPEAARFLMDSAAALRRRELERSEFWSAWKGEKGTYKGARRAWNKYIGSTPLLGVNPASGRPVFYSEFRDTVLEGNSWMGEDDIRAVWKKRYGRN